MSDKFVYESLKISIAKHARRQASQAFAYKMQPKLAEIQKLSAYDQQWEISRLLEEFFDVYVDGLAQLAQSYYDLANEAISISTKPILIRGNFNEHDSNNEARPSGNDN